MYKLAHTWNYMCVVQTHVGLSVYMHMYVYVYIYMESEKETHAHTHTHPRTNTPQHVYIQRQPDSQRKHV